MEKYDICIIGSGIAGLTAAIYLKRVNANFIILENKIPGGMLNSLQTVENYPGFNKTMGRDILLNLMDQVKNLGISITYGSVQTILMEKEGFEVVTDVDSYMCKSVIVASGLSKGSSTIKNEDKYIGSGVSYCATCDGNFFKGKDVAVIGNNNIALEEALYLSNLASKLYFITDQDQLNGDLQLIDAIKKQNNVEIMLNTAVDEIVGDNFGVSGIKIKGDVINIDGIFPYIGTKSSAMFLSNLYPSKNNECVIVDNSMMSSVPGLFAAGDIVDKPLKQLVTAASDGAIAATSAYMYVKKLGK